MKWNRIGAVPIILAVFLTSGCATFTRPAIEAQNIEEARAQIGRIQEINSAVTAYKGIGELKIFSDEGTWAIRGAWIGAPGGRFRVEPLGVAGQPLAKLICDHDACYFLFSEDGCYKKRESREKSLEPLTGINIGIDDLALLLGGGVPVYPHDFAWIDAGEQERVLILESRFHGVIEKIFAGPDWRVNRVEVYGWRGIRYRADLGERLAGSRIPRALRIENEKNAGIRIRVDRSWTDVLLREDAFFPRLPETGKCD